MTNWIAVDWGTTHLRAWVMAGNVVQAALTSAKGMGGLAPDQFEPALLELISEHLPGQGVTPVICCGMVGARQGWIEAAYAPVPCPLPGIERATRAPTHDPRIEVHILPGLSQAKPADVMRGEETQIAGFLAQDPRFDGVICLPGTHTKWVQISAEEVVSFRTFMTGEMFALLSEQSVLRHGVDPEGWADDVFETAVSDALSRPQGIAAELFSLRAAGLLHETSGGTTRARLSGLLIGLELAGSRPYWLGQRVVLLGAPALATLYAKALDLQGVSAESPDADAITLAGLSAAYARHTGDGS